jgi:hypothetical protein
VAVTAVVDIVLIEEEKDGGNDTEVINEEGAEVVAGVTIATATATAIVVAEIIITVAVIEVIYDNDTQLVPHHRLVNGGGMNRMVVVVAEINIEIIDDDI